MFAGISFGNDASRDSILCRVMSRNCLEITARDSMNQFMVHDWMFKTLLLTFPAFRAY